MTKKDYIKLAKVIKETSFRKEGQSDIILKDDFMGRLSGILKEDNPRFVRDKFYQACYS